MAPSLTRQPSNLKAALWMAGWLALMLAMMIAARESAREINTFQLMEIRSLMGIVMLWPLVHFAGGLRAMRTSRMPLHIARNTVHYAGQFCWFLALTMIPLSQLVAIEFTLPIWTAILAVSWLGEHMNRWKLLAIVLGLAGVMIIVRPSGSDINIGHFIILAGSIGFGISIVAVKSLTSTDSTVKIIFWMLVIQSALGIIPSLIDWVWPSPAVWGWMVIVAFCGTFSHFCMTRAMLYADATIVVPLDFLRLPFSALIGWLLYSEGLDAYTAAGAALILLGNLFNLKRAPRALATT